MTDTQFQFFDKFEQIYFINMSKDVERLQSITLQFDRISHKLLRFEAVTPETLPEFRLQELADNNQANKYAEYWRIVETTRQKQIEMCLSLGHAAVISQAIEQFEKNRQQTNFLILEDDAVINEDVTEFEWSHYTTWLLRHLGNRADLIQLGYTCFTGNQSSWMFNREYCIDAKLYTDNSAHYDSGVFGTLGYALSINYQNVQYFKELVAVLLQGVIADFTISEARKLRKYFFKHKLLMPMPTESTISTGQMYYTVEQGYYQNLFELGYVKNSDNFNNMSITVKRPYSNKLYVFFVRVNDDDTTMQYYTEYCNELASFSQIEQDIKDFSDKYKHANRIKIAYVVKFINTQKPNLGDKIYVKQTRI